MSILTYQMKTHSRTPLEYDMSKFNPCKRCGLQPKALRIVYGSKKNKQDIIYCSCDDNTTTMVDSNEDSAKKQWNYWNPKLETE